MLCYLPCWVSPKEAFWGHSPPSGKDMEFLSCPVSLRSWGDRWQLCFNHQELAISLRKPLHRTSQELSWLWHLPEEMLGNSLTPLASLRVSTPYHHSPCPVLLQYTYKCFFGGTMTNRVMACWPDSYFSILQSLQRRKSTWHVYVWWLRLRRGRALINYYSCYYWCLFYLLFIKVGWRRNQECILRSWK